MTLNLCTNICNMDYILISSILPSQYLKFNLRLYITECYADVSHNLKTYRN